MKNAIELNEMELEEINGGSLPEADDGQGDIEIIKEHQKTIKRAEKLLKEIIETNAVKAPAEDHV